ncbi:beta-glucuronidase [Phenylobacterium aquaticum]|uniref:beta-glucuronidase n=1 Tax=Phenylobacterium aquaticum TaxID=1763816 RepID=UPI0026EBE1A2|nr:beta-glucuronidase [Phenylobacterium aquaticum]
MAADTPRTPPPAMTRRQAVGAFGLAASVATAAAAPARAGPHLGGLARGPSTLLYPHESPTRSVRDLSGLWRFQMDPTDQGESQKWFVSGLPEPRPIPVPCSWNDLFDDARDYFGTAWYETEFQLDPGWRGRRLHLRFGSAVYHARVWLNGEYLGEHVGGHLPFAFDVTGLAHEGQPNRLSVSVENKPLLDRVPSVPDVRSARMYQVDFPQTAYDFFPYCGLHRPVVLFTTPDAHLQDVTVTTGLSGSAGLVGVAVTVSGGWSGAATLTLSGGPKPVSVSISVKNGAGSGQLKLPAARAWSPEDPFLYRLTIKLGGEAGGDEYVLKIGVRTIEVKGSEIRLNGKPIFLTGFGKHEDFPIHGKGLDLPVLVRDYELLKWIGANSFRTSHYPYSEESLMLADEYGFLVIAETPGVSLVFMDPPEIIEARLRQLSQATSELVHRDKNHPCVIMWSLANEPIPKPFHTVNDVPPGAVEAGTRFFERLFAHARTLDKSRPIALVSVQNGPADWVGQGDVICTNSYNGWYAVSGQIDVATTTLEKEIVALRARHGDKPVIFTEFGADAVAGVHAQPAEMWSEDYQAQLIEAYWRTLRKHPYIVGAHPWAFADFKTAQGIMRVGSLNQKGVFTRDRRPKLAAHKLRELWAKV